MNNDHDEVELGDGCGGVVGGGTAIGGGGEIYGTTLLWQGFFSGTGSFGEGIGAAGRDVLLKALQEFQGTFETGWETSINAQDTINATFVSLEFAEWFVPELQRADFPVPSQYPSETGDTF